MESDLIGNRSPQRTVASAFGKKKKKMRATESEAVGKFALWFLLVRLVK